MCEFGLVAAGTWCCTCSRLASKVMPLDNGCCTSFHLLVRTVCESMSSTTQLKPLTSSRRC